MAFDLSVKLGPIVLPNPVMVASGTFGYGTEYQDLYDPGRLGGLVTKGVSLAPRAGNPPPRIAETPAGMLNSIGLENPGLASFLEEKAPFYVPLSCKVFVNIFGEAIEEYAELAARLAGVLGIDGIEMNISCPNVKCGGLQFGQDPRAIESVVRAVRDRTKLPLMVKLSPNVSDIAESARAAEQGGADILSLINTVRGMAIDLRTRQPKLRTVTGGLSGPAIHPIAVAMVYAVCQAVKLPVVGIGGIMTPGDAIELMLAGAAAVQVGTGNFRNPLLPIEVIDAIPGFLERYNLTAASELTGAMAKTTPPGSTAS